MSVQVLGLTQPEMAYSRETLLEQVWPSDVMPYETLEAMFVAPAAGSTAGTAAAPPAAE